MARYQGERMGFADSLEEMYEHVNARYAPYYYSEELGFYMDDFYAHESAQVWMDNFTDDMDDEEVQEFEERVEYGPPFFTEIEVYGFVYQEGGYNDGETEINLRPFQV